MNRYESTFMISLFNESNHDEHHHLDVNLAFTEKQNKTKQNAQKK